MKFNRRGDLGFPEAIMAAMIVTLSLTAYMGLFALNIADDGNISVTSIDHRTFSCLSLADGEIAGDIESRLVSEMERRGLNGISFICEVPGGFGYSSRSVTVGNMDGRIDCERFLFTLKSQDGRIIPAVMEVAVCS
ncbi:MAG: hypothetical protein LBH88_03075 [Candidatus Methanoplasma sp.]|jgi:hypothetical protein|nr:hypothetical protein [Candidatus Methanoplasma sp.]